MCTHLDDFRGGPNKNDTGVRACIDKRLVLREKPVTGMNRITLGTLGNANDLRNVQIGADWGCALREKQRVNQERHINVRGSFAIP